MVNTYDKGDVVRISGAFTDATPIALDPTAILFRFRDPDGTETSYAYGIDSQIVKDSVGQYHVDIDADIYGRYFYRMWSTGVGKAAAEGEFWVKASGVS